MDRGNNLPVSRINLSIKPVIVCVVKKEQKYIYEFINYHLLLGFTHIYIYDNEDEPTYEKQLKPYFKDKITVKHVPGGFHEHGNPIQMVILRHFMRDIINNPKITHVAHIDIDEFICLKKHDDIKDFINEYIKTDTNNVNCSAIGMHWRHFGSSGHETYKVEPNTQRFTNCQLECKTRTIKDLFYAKDVELFLDVHHIHPYKYPRKTTSGEILPPRSTADSKQVDYNVIQLNHYKSKTREEFYIIRQRGYADRHPCEEDVEKNFREFDLNETEDFTARDFYQKHNKLHIIKND